MANSTTIPTPHTAYSAALSSTQTLVAPLTATSVTVDNINHSSFLKYASLHVDDKDGIPSFYKSMQTQGALYNIFLRPYESITETNTAIPTCMAKDVELATAVTIYAKMVQNDVISHTFTMARKLLSVTTNGFDFLKELLRLVHPMLSINQIASINIPNFSTSGDLYTYAASILHWIEKHGMKQRSYDQLEITSLFLDHLDDDRYIAAVQLCKAGLLNQTSVPIIYLLPTIATTIEQLVPNPPPTREQQRGRP